MNESKRVAERRERLEALRSRSRNAKKVDFSKMAEADPRMAKVNGPASDADEAGGLLARLQGAGGKPQIERMLEFLTFDGPGAKMIPGTAVNKERLKRLLQFINVRSQEKDVPKWVSQVRRILGSAGAKTMIDDLETDKVNDLMKFLRSRTGENGADQGRRTAAEPVGEKSGGGVEIRLAALEQSMKELLDRIAGINEQLTAIRSELARQAQDGPSTAGKRADASLNGEPVANWFDETMEDR